MKIKILFFLLASAICFNVHPQDYEQDVLFTVDGDPVKVGEFLRVYNKNLDLVKDETQKNIDTYLDLFINYSLKLKEARLLEYDKKPEYIREFKTYKKQLAKNYLTDKRVTEELVNEAYERISNDVKASHILVRLPETETDTMAVYKQMLAFRDRLLQEEFEQIQKDSHNGNTVFVEDLGWFSGFKMVYDFENVAYNTPVGEVSQPFRTQFGYHVLKVFDKRKSRGRVTVGHIFLSKQSPDSLGDPKTRIQEIYRLFKNGQAFEDLAKQYSEDQGSAKQGGRLKSFKSGQLSSVKFEDRAFAIGEIGDVTEPFETDYGWHIAKLYEKEPIGSFMAMKSQLEVRVKRDSRSAVINKAFLNTLKEKYEVQSDIDLSYFVSILNEDYFSRKWVVPTDLPEDKMLIQIGKNVLSYKDFGSYLESAQKRIREKQSYEGVVQSQFKEFVNERLLAYHEENLEFTNLEYAQILKEYRDGLLLFDLMEDIIWNAVKDDSTGLNRFYQSNKERYVRPESVKAIMVSSMNQDVLQKVIPFLNKNQDIDALRSKFKSTAKEQLIITQQTFQSGTSKLPETLAIKLGTSEIFKHNGSYHVIRVDEIIPESIKTFEEAKGIVISDYQEYTEQKWLEGLRDKFSVEVNTNVMDQIKANLDKR
ncbi:MAG: peptidylprolyl isomerase [Bacteroidia bacterium]|nr:peptidylprolyl isomerase [Bacteroidia bacterium]